MLTKYEIAWDAAPIPNRINEDSYYFGDSNGLTTIAVIDGATPRLSLKRLETVFYDTQANNGATYASRITSRACGQAQQANPKQILLKANTTIRQVIEDLYGEFDAKTILAQEPHLIELLEDERNLRLALPVAVATVIQINLHNMTLDFAHAGDTYLLVFNQDGRVEQLTIPQMAQHDQAALREAEKVKAESDLTHFADAIDHPRVKQQNLGNALFHNFTDLQGNTDKAKGVGVINGMTQLETYIQTGTVDLANSSGILLATDGAILPSPLDETEQQFAEKLHQIRYLIESEGLHNYINKLRKIEAEDRWFDNYPRFKMHDDATAIYLELTS